MGNISLEEVAQSHIQPSPVHFHGQASETSLGNPFHGLSTLTVNFFLRSNLNTLSFSLKLYPLAPLLHTLVTRPSPAFL